MPVRVPFGGYLLRATGRRHDEAHRHLNTMLAVPGTEGATLTAAPGAVLGGGASSPGQLWAPPGGLSRVMQVLSNLGLATFTTTGFSAAASFTSTGAVNADTTDGCWVRVTTTTTTGNAASVTTPNCCRRDWSPDAAFYVKLGSTITNVRYWVGLFSAAPSGSATPAVHLAGFRYDTAADGTTRWRAVTNAGGTPTVTEITAALSGAPPGVVASGAYRLRVECRAAAYNLSGVDEVWFYVNNIRVAVHQATLPTATTVLHAGVYVTNLGTGGASARVVDVSRVAVSHV